MSYKVRFKQIASVTMSMTSCGISLILLERGVEVGYRSDVSDDGDVYHSDEPSSNDTEDVSDDDAVISIEWFQDYHGTAEPH